MVVSELLAVFAFLQGLLIGSFLNVVIDRIPCAKHLGGRSHCDGCGRTLRFIELIPIVSYVWQRGKSTCCRVRLSLQYPLVELATGVSFALVTYWYVGGYAIVTPTLIFSLLGLLVITASSIAIAVIDFRYHIIPDVLQVALLIGVLMLHLGMGILRVEMFGQALVVALPILIIYLITRGRGMGFGDVKMQVTLGLWLGLFPGFFAVYIAFVTGAFYGVILMLLKQATRKSQIAFGPFLLLGAWVVYIGGTDILRMVNESMGLSL